MEQMDIIVDMSWGSTGKGLLASVLAQQYAPDTLVTAFAPNAGHTSYTPDGHKLVHKMLANGITSPNTERVLIGPGAVINEAILVAEIENAEKLGLISFDRVYVHENAACVLDKHIEAERDFGRIGSTQTGSGAALIQKIIRDPDNTNIARDAIRDPRVVVVDDREYLSILEKGRIIQVEGAQGFGLSIHHGFYPYVTSRDVTPAQILADCGIPWWMGRKARVIGTTRTYPIRVNNKTGWSGPCYEDQREISFEDLGQPVELTTVTKLPRRIFTFSKNQINHAVRVCSPDELFLNFCNYCRTADELLEIVEYLMTEAYVRYYGFGPRPKDVLDIHGMTGHESRRAIREWWERYYAKS